MSLYCRLNCLPTSASPMPEAYLALICMRSENCGLGTTPMYLVQQWPWTGWLTDTYCLLFTTAGLCACYTVHNLYSFIRFRFINAHLAAVDPAQKEAMRQLDKFACTRNCFSAYFYCFYTIPFHPPPHPHNNAWPENAVTLFVGETFFFLGIFLPNGTWTAPRHSSAGNTSALMRRCTPAVIEFLSRPSILKSPQNMAFCSSPSTQARFPTPSSPGCMRENQKTFLTPKTFTSKESFLQWKGWWRTWAKTRKWGADRWHSTGCTLLSPSLIGCSNRSRLLPLVQCATTGRACQLSSKAQLGDKKATTWCFMKLVGRSQSTAG